MSDKDDIYKLVGIRVQLLRLLRGISRKELADQLGITPDHLARLEKGQRHMRTAMIIRCSEILNTTNDFLIAGKGVIFKEQMEEVPQDNALHTSKKNGST